MKVVISRAKVKPDQLEAIFAAGKRVNEALQRARPQGFLYAVCPLSGGVSFITLIITDDGVDNPLLALPEYQEFAAHYKTWIAEPPVVEQLTASNPYRFF